MYLYYFIFYIQAPFWGIPLSHSSRTCCAAPIAAERHLSDSEADSDSVSMIFLLIFHRFPGFFGLRSSLKIHEFTVDFTVLTLISVVSVWVSVQKSSAKFKLRRAQFLTSHLFRGQRWKPKLSWGKACHAELVQMHDVSKTFVFKERRYTHAISCNHMISYAPHASLHMFYSHIYIYIYQTYT